MEGEAKKERVVRFLNVPTGNSSPFFVDGVFDPKELEAIKRELRQIAEQEASSVLIVEWREGKKTVIKSPIEEEGREGCMTHCERTEVNLKSTIRALERTIEAALEERGWLNPQVRITKFDGKANHPYVHPGIPRYHLRLKTEGQVKSDNQGTQPLSGVIRVEEGDHGSYTVIYLHAPKKFTIDSDFVYKKKGNLMNEYICEIEGDNSPNASEIYPLSKFLDYVGKISKLEYRSWNGLIRSIRFLYDGKSLHIFVEMSGWLRRKMKDYGIRPEQYEHIIFDT